MMTNNLFKLDLTLSCGESVVLIIMNGVLIAESHSAEFGGTASLMDDIANNLESSLNIEAVRADVNTHLSLEALNELELVGDIRDYILENFYESRAMPIDCMFEDDILIPFEALHAFLLPSQSALISYTMNITDIPNAAPKMELSGTYSSDWEEGDVTSKAVICTKNLMITDVAVSDDGEDYQHHIKDYVSIYVNGELQEFPCEQGDFTFEGKALFAEQLTLQNDLF